MIAVFFVRWASGVQLSRVGSVGSVGSGGSFVDSVVGEGTLRIEGNDYSVFAIGEGDASRHNGKYITIRLKLSDAVTEGSVITRGPF